MNGLRTRLNLDATQQKVHNQIGNVGDSLVGWVGCIGLVVFIILELSWRFL